MACPGLSNTNVVHMRDQRNPPQKKGVFMVGGQNVRLFSLKKDPFYFYSGAFSVSKISVRVSTTSVYFKQFKIFCSHLRNADFACRYIRTLCKISWTILLFYQKTISQLKCHSESFEIHYSRCNHQMRFTMVHSNTKNSKSSVD